jgi:hypothetical protein
MTPQDESYPSYCRERVAECRRHADQSVTGDLKAAFLDMEKMWLAAAEAPAQRHTERRNDQSPRSFPPYIVDFLEILDDLTESPILLRP